MVAKSNMRPLYAKRHGAEKTKQDGPIGHFCSKVYPTYFEPIKDEPIKLLEIGIYEGNSLRMWRDYFTKAQIYGLDVDPSRKFEEERIHTFIGDQSSRDVLKALPGPFDIVIDDGSHKCQDMITSFECLFPMLPAGGLYFIEDTNLIRKEVWNPADEFTPYFTKIALDVAANRNKEIEFIHFYRSIVVVRKRDV
jgi:hypothetical protein